MIAKRIQDDQINNDQVLERNQKKILKNQEIEFIRYVIIFIHFLICLFCEILQNIFKWKLKKYYILIYDFNRITFIF